MDEEEDCSAMEAILSIVPHKYMESLGPKDSTKATWDTLKTMRWLQSDEEGEGAAAEVGIQGASIL